MDIVEKPENQVDKRSKTWFKPGKSGNPKGRPKGQSLKEFWRARFANMTDDERLEFTKKVQPEAIWKMAEGQPPQEMKIQGELVIKTNEIKVKKYAGSSGQSECK